MELCIDDHIGNQSVILDVIAGYTRTLNDLLETLLEKYKAKSESYESLVEVVRNVDGTFRRMRAQLLRDNMPLLPSAIRIESAIKNTYEALEAKTKTAPEPVSDEMRKFLEKLDGALEESKENIADGNFVTLCFMLTSFVVMDLLRQNPIDQDAVVGTLLAYYYDLKAMCAGAVTQVTTKKLPASLVRAALVQFRAQWEALLPFKEGHEFVIPRVRSIVDTIQEAISQIEFPGTQASLSSNLKFSVSSTPFSKIQKFTPELAPKKVDWDDLGGKGVSPAPNTWNIDSHIQMGPPDSPPFNLEDDEDDAGLLFKNIDPEKLDYTVHQPSYSSPPKVHRREDFSTIDRQFHDIEDLVEQYNVSRNHESLLETLPSYLNSLVATVTQGFPDVSKDLAECKLAHFMCCNLF